MYVCMYTHSIYQFGKLIHWKGLNLGLCILWKIYNKHFFIHLSKSMSMHHENLTRQTTKRLTKIYRILLSNNKAEYVFHYGTLTQIDMRSKRWANICRKGPSIDHKWHQTFRLFLTYLPNVECGPSMKFWKIDVLFYW